MRADGTDAAAANSGCVLLTGATGFVGMEILGRYLERTERRICALVRANDDAEARDRLDHALSLLFDDAGAYSARVDAIAGDIERPGLGLLNGRRMELAAKVSDVVHCAASVSFSLPIEQAREVNVEGTRRMLELAELCHRHGGIEHFSYVSTAYVAGTHEGEFREDDLDVGQSFRNPYELSKFEAEKLVREYAGRLPIQIFRPSIVVGEHTSGWTVSFNVLYTPLKAFAHGALPALPAASDAPVDVVPVDYVADAVFELANRPPDRSCETYHLVAGDRATTVGRLVQLSAAHLQRRPPRLVPPRIFDGLARPALWLMRNRRSRAALDRMRVFFPYFAMRVRYANERTRDRLAPLGIDVPAIDRYYDRLIDFALRARWGREQLSRPQATGRDERVRELA